MTLDPIHSVPSPNPTTGPERRPTTPEEAAQQFEAVLIRQFVSVMTDTLFKDGLAGDDGPGWVKSQQHTQRDVLTDVLTEHLVESRSLRLADLLMRQWSRGTDQPTPTDGESL
jgi:flagellar protein FlgJ